MRNLNQLFLWGRIVNSNGILMYFMVRKTPFSGCKMLFSDVKTQFYYLYGSWITLIKKSCKHLSLSPPIDNILAISNLLFCDGDRRFGNRAETAQKQRFLSKRLHEDVLRISKKTLRGDLDLNRGLTLFRLPESTCTLSHLERNMCQKDYLRKIVVTGIAVSRIYFVILPGN